MLKSLHKDDTQTTPFVVTKNWRLSNVANEDLILMEHSGSEGLPVALEYVDYNIYAPTTASGCDIALEQQELNLALFKDGLKVKGTFYPETDPQNEDGTYQRCVYTQVAGMFYNNYRDPTKMWGLEKIDFEYGVWRMTNLLAAWHDQLIEVMGAMGMREVRRLRGDVGRAMFFENLEKETFGKLFGTRKSN